MAELNLKPFDDQWLTRRGNYYALIAPDKAAELMARNENNRAIKQLKIDQYARDMADGAWNPDASDIKFDKDGKLLDGQNRLLACIQADVPFPTFVRTGLDPEAFNFIDTGAVRTTGDVFKRAGVGDYHVVASAVSLRARYESILATGHSIIERRLPLTRHQALGYLSEHPQLEKLAQLGRSMNAQAPGIQRAVWVAGLSMFAEKDEDAARRFAAQFLAEEPVPQLIALMRYAMTTSPSAVQARQMKYKNAGLRHLTAVVSTWNAVRRGEDLPRLTIKEDAKPEAVA